MKRLSLIALLALAACNDDGIARYQETGDQTLTDSQRSEMLYSRCNSRLDAAYPNNINTLKNGALCADLMASMGEF